MNTLSLTLFLVIICSVGFAQKPTVFRIDSLPKQGILLNKNWKWHAGDNPDFAKVDFDDSAWESIDPTKDIMSLKQIWKADKGWFRLKFYVDSSLVNKSLVMQVKQTGASEIFLNGQFIEKFGKIDTKTRQMQAATPIDGSFIELPIRNKGEQVLTVQFAVQKNISYLKFAQRANVALSLRVMETSATRLVIENNITPYFDFFRFGLFLILSILHFALFWSDKSQKANLYFFLYAFLSTIYNVLIGLVYNQVSFASTKMIFLFAIAVLTMVANVFFLTAVYHVFNRQRSFIYWILCVYSVVGFVLLFVNYQNGFDLAVNIPGILILFESVRITVLAKRKKQRGANIMLIGAVSYLIFYALFNLFAFGYLPVGPKWIYGHLAFNLSFISLPIAISIYLALESAFKSNSLKLKLIENETLSAEKQQILSTQNETLEKQVKERMTELVATQNQLIQKEKLASLGELTAGIAHEIQNPLNFVNNFSELSVELLNELKSPLTPDGGIRKGEKVDMDLFEDVVVNLEKINLHGKRASSIVKGMLEHSRTSTGVKELTDMNKLADEYLRLSYHGLRAKDKSFNADYGLITDPNLPKINVIPQDMGRVLLNLINNAFQSSPLTPRGGVSTLGTKKTHKVIVKTFKIESDGSSPSGVGPSQGGGGFSVTDNGTGMSEATKAKIFQPFFTTKPTGQGTGLGLSLAYDIVTKGHDGTIEVESVEGEGTTFIVKLPIL